MKRVTMRCGITIQNVNANEIKLGTSGYRWQDWEVLFFRTHTCKSAKRKRVTETAGKASRGARL